MSKMKIAFVQDWLTSYGGGEKCIEALCELWPQADIFTLVYNPDVFKGSIISRHRVQSSFIQTLPFSKRFFRHYFPLYPLAVEQYDLRPYDVVISFSAAFSHGVMTHPGQVHISYKHTPMRYAWSGYQEYLQDPALRSRWKRNLTRLILHYHRQWDFQAAQRVDYFVANSCEVQKRIEKYYRRTAEVIYPPVEVESLTSHEPVTKEDYYITFSRLVPYKRVDCLVRAFTAKTMSNRRLIVGGDGPELKSLKKMAEGCSNIEFIGFVNEEQKRPLLQKAKGFLFAAHEDFGIVPVEAQAAGTPVIAFRKGGAMETVVENKTGVFFDQQTPESLTEAIQRFETIRWNTDELIGWANGFSLKRYQDEISAFVESKSQTIRG
jgi:glycosyltransferase involved in cell wall biosynthesis